MALPKTRRDIDRGHVVDRPREVPEAVDPGIRPRMHPAAPAQADREAAGG